MAKRKTASKEVVVPGKRTDAEQALLSHMENGYELQTDLFGANRVLRWLKGDEEIRTASANRGTVKVLQKRGLIVSREGREPLTLV